MSDSHVKKVQKSLAEYMQKTEKICSVGKVLDQINEAYFQFCVCHYKYETKEKTERVKFWKEVKECLKEFEKRACDGRSELQCS